jgi:nucleotide-binding universal stress UspA family protein
VRLKDILVHVDNSPASQVRLRLACDIARRHAAHLAALYCIEPLPIAAFSPWGDPGYTDFPATEEIKKQYRAAAFGAMDRAEAAFRAKTDGADISTEWRVSEGAGVASLIQQVRCADLTVLGQVDPGHASISRAGPEEIVLASGRPALIVPAVGHFEAVGRRVLVAWNASREAARALGDALPLLADAQAVTVLSISPTDIIESEHRGADVTRHLARHGISAIAAASTAAEVEVGDVLLSHAADHGADLIVMGAYGHSRTREWLLGGATRHLLRHMTVPVLMAH